MHFDEIGEVTVLTLFADGLRTLAEACELAGNTDPNPMFPVLQAAFQSAARIAANHELIERSEGA